MGALTEIESGTFRVDFATLSAGGLVSRLLHRRPVAVTVQSIGGAVLTALRLSPQRGMDKRIIAWNQYRICLSRSDYDLLHPLRDRLRTELELALAGELDRLQADTIGDPVVQVLVDDEADLPGGVGMIYASYKKNDQLVQAGDANVTVRVRRTPARPAARTERVVEPLTGAIQVSWPGGSVTIARGQKVQMGRPHAQAPAGFVGLSGASNRINSLQLAVDNTDHGVVITRPAEANPVIVGGRLVQPGGKLAVADLPVEVDLSSGDLQLLIEALS